MRKIQNNKEELSRLVELLQYRRVNNEYDVLMELLRPDISTSKKLEIVNGEKVYSPTRYKELSSKSLATGNFSAEKADEVDEISIIALTLQNITESSEGLFDLSEAHDFFAGLQGIETQISKSKGGKLLELARTTINISKGDLTQIGLTGELKKKPLPTHEDFNK